MSDTVQVVPGDTLTLTLTGKVADPAARNARSTQVRVYRPGGSSLMAAEINVNATLDTEATLTYDVKSVFKNGVHIDKNGRYWMRKPDGWHEMSVTSRPVPSIFGSQFAPAGVQRLKEDQ